jgi:LmbE family N-acetylglucosaminyl deacetylase
MAAHPDDEVLLCGGTIALLTKLGADVHVTCFADGAQGRDSWLGESCASLGATHELLNLPTSAMTLDGRLVAMTDRLVIQRQPHVVITHSASGTQSQDHVVLHRAVMLTVCRNVYPSVLLAGEPPISSIDFQPNVFVDVEQCWGQKLQAVAYYQSVLDRYYLKQAYLEVRAAWWRQVARRDTGLYEAFQLVTWRP